MDKEVVSVNKEEDLPYANDDIQTEVFVFNLLEELQGDPCKNCRSVYCSACCYEFCSACCPYCMDENRAGIYPPVSTLSRTELKRFEKDLGT
jgi:hypothetical protein